MKSDVNFRKPLGLGGGAGHRDQKGQETKQGRSWRLVRGKQDKDLD